jgi:hypothetical protein
MSRNTKIILTIFGGAVLFLLLCALSVVVSLSGSAWEGVSRAMTFDAQDIAGSAAEIAQFELPYGYGPDYALAIGGFHMVSFDPGDNHSHLMLVQSPAWLNLDPTQFEQQLRRDYGDRLKWSERSEAKVVDHRTLRIEGQPVEFAISEGVNSEGADYRTMAGIWDGPNGQVFIYIEEPLSRWNQAEIDAFVASIQA